MNIEKLSPLIGKWKGKGHASFPTITPAEYIEELVFERMGKNHVLFFMQKTFYRVFSPLGKSSGASDPLHWESGYIKVLDYGSYQLSNAQDNGRVEVLTGKIINNENGIFHISFESKLFGNDERMVKTMRDYIIEGNTMKFNMKMATQKTPELQEHLRAELNLISR